ncbi:MAG: FAD-binding protein, partial [Pseudomonadota bacterium]
MKNRRQFDLVVFGAEPAGLAAAACAARAGAKCAVIKTGYEMGYAGAAPSVPNFVWRQLELHETGLSVAPVDALVSLFEDGRSIATFEDDRRTQDALLASHPSDGALWLDYQAELARRRAATCDQNGQFIASLSAPETLSLDSATTDSVSDILADYFESDDLKTHLSTVAGLAFSLGGEEPGSGAALASVADADAWRVRDGEILAMTLERVCERAGVERFASAVASIEQHDPRTLDIDFELGDDIRTRALMASSARVARAAGLRVKGGASLDDVEAAEALISVKLAEAPKPPKTDAEGEAFIYYIGETEDALRDARAAVLEGRTPDEPPMSFEFSDHEIIVRTRYCPRVLHTEEGPREWTGQDRQALDHAEHFHLGC